MRQLRGNVIYVLAAMAASVVVASLLSAPVSAIGVGSPVPYPAVRVHVHSGLRHKANRSVVSKTKRQRHLASTRLRGKKGHAVKVAKRKLPVPLPQNLIASLASKTMAPGVVYKHYRGALNINVIDADMMAGSLRVRPVLAGSSFCQLADVKCHARQINAIAAVNANYFKKDGTPLGTLIIDKELVSGPLYDRVSLGITGSGYVKMERVNLYGILHTSNAKASSIWVNNINQPRRSGSRLIVYTRRWGSFVKLPYAGTLLAVDNTGKVMDKSTNVMGIPWGGYVLCDSKHSPIADLERGDQLSISWHTKPDNWSDVVEAVSGGPMLIRNGKLYVDLKDERFVRGWTSSKITARTAAGVTANNHLLLVTIEGPHTLWDMAKFLQKLGAVEGLNLDGGGSTTMVVNGQTVTRNGSSYQRRVASALAIIGSSLPANKPGLNLSSGQMTLDVSETPALQQDASGASETTSSKPATQAAEPSPLVPATSPDTMQSPPVSSPEASPQTAPKPVSMHPSVVTMKSSGPESQPLVSTAPKDISDKRNHHHRFFPFWRKS